MTQVPLRGIWNKSAQIFMVLFSFLERQLQSFDGFLEFGDISIFRFSVSIASELFSSATPKVQTFEESHTKKMAQLASIARHRSNIQENHVFDYQVKLGHCQMTQVPLRGIWNKSQQIVMVLFSFLERQLQSSSTDFWNSETLASLGSPLRQQVNCSPVQHQ